MESVIRIIIGMKRMAVAVEVAIRTVDRMLNILSSLLNTKEIILTNPIW